jgi:HPP family
MSPPIVSSLFELTWQGATAVLLYGAIEAPFAQPRAIFFGHTFSAIIGVGITKAFLRLPPATFADDMWLAGSIACALATTFMSMTKTIHPPSGGTALMAATQAEIRALGWYYVPVVMLSAVLMMGVGFILNNIQRQWPSYWWTSVPLGPVLPKMEPEPKTQAISIDTAANGVGYAEVRRTGSIVMNVDGVFVPEFMELTYDQRAVLDELQTKIEEYYEVREEKERRKSETLSRERSSRRSREERKSFGDPVGNAV